MLFTQQFFSVTSVIAADRTINSAVTGSSTGAVVSTEANSTLTITNTGSVTNTNSDSNATGIENPGTSSSTTINNSGIISAQQGVNYPGSAGTAYNPVAFNNLISGQIQAVRIGIYFNDENYSSLGSITNAGSIVATYTRSPGDNICLGSGICTFSRIGTITNTGSISTTGLNIFNSRAVDIDGNGDTYYTFVSHITNLNNAQGGSGASAKQTALTYGGELPKNYNIIINSPTHYGQLSISDAVNKMAFGIYNTSIVTVGTYKGALQGFGNNLGTYISSGTTGTYGIYDWSFSQQGTSGVWD
jgi:hypothetical protein